MINYKHIKYILPPKIFNWLIDFYLCYFINTRNLTIKKHDIFFDITNNKNECIRISRKHNIYLIDIINSFDYYFSSVKPIFINNLQLVDYSTPRYQDVIGYETHPIIFSSFAEPIITTHQYLKFAKLKNGSVVLDLGAYSGLTSIIFSEKSGKKGQVIAIEADKINIKCVQKNFLLHEKITNKKIELLEGAVWENDNGLEFSSEGNMGSSANSIIGQRGKENNLNHVKSYTLNTIAKKYNLKKIDFIKCDIEGAESTIFKDKKFFKKYKPRIIIEPHIIDGKSTLQECKNQLSNYGYQFKKIDQHGVNLPLLECWPRHSN